MNCLLCCSKLNYGCNDLKQKSRFLIPCSIRILMVLWFALIALPRNPEKYVYKTKTLILSTSYHQCLNRARAKTMESFIKYFVEENQKLKNQLSASPAMQSSTMQLQSPQIQSHNPNQHQLIDSHSMVLQLGLCSAAVANAISRPHNFP